MLFRYVANAEEPDLAGARLALCKAVLVVLRDAMNLVCIPFLEAMWPTRLTKSPI